VDGTRYVIELAGPADIARLAEIERAAASLFEIEQIPPSARDEVTPYEEFAAAQAAGRLWVAHSAAQVVGFALVELLGGCPHLEEMDVHPAHGRRGIGRALMRAVITWARAAGHASITLTTFRDVAWNAPFYASLGFEVVEPPQLPPALIEVVEDEAARGLDRDRRVVMRCDLSPLRADSARSTPRLTSSDARPAPRRSRG
jgi:GNAT superfamily N-acetyltransferase